MRLWRLSHLLLLVGPAATQIPRPLPLASPLYDAFLFFFDDRRLGSEEVHELF